MMFVPSNLHGRSGFGSPRALLPTVAFVPVPPSEAWPYSPKSNHNKPFCPCPYLHSLDLQSVPGPCHCCCECAQAAMFLLAPSLEVSCCRSTALVMGGPILEALMRRGRESILLYPSCCLLYRNLPLSRFLCARAGPHSSRDVYGREAELICQATNGMRRIGRNIHAVHSLLII